MRRSGGVDERSTDAGGSFRDGDNWSAHAAVTNTELNDDNSSTATQRKAAVGQRDGKTQVDLSQDRTVTDASGKQVQTKANAGYGEGGEVRAGAGAFVDGKGAEMSMTVDQTGDDKQVAFDTKVGLGKTSVKVQGGVQWVVRPPKPVGNAWVVEYEERALAGGGVGYNTRGETKAGGEAGVQVTNVYAGKRIFDSESEAKAFYDKGQIGEEDKKIPTGVQELLALKPGEERSELNGKSGSLGLTGSSGMISVGVGGDAQGTDSMKVTRAAGSFVEVEVGDSDGYGLAASFGVGFASLGANTFEGSARSRTVRFDLSKPEAVQAYERFQETRSLQGDGGAGVEVIASSESETEGHGLTQGAGPLQYGETHTTTHVDETRGGHDFEHDIGTDRMRISAPFLGHLERSHQMHAWEVDDQDSFFSVTSTVDASSSSDAASGLVRATESSRDNASGDASGTWAVKSKFKPAEIDQFISYVKGKNFWWKTDSWFRNYGDRLVSKLRKAKDKDAERAAVAWFVSEAGEDALERVREVTGGGKDYHLELAGDLYWTGLEANTRLELLAGDLEGQVSMGSTDKVAVYAAASEKLEYLNDKIEAIPHYDDVPDRLLWQELDRARALRDRFQGVMEQAQAAPDLLGEGRDVEAEDPALARVLGLASRMRQARGAMLHPRQRATSAYRSVEEGFRREDHHKKASEQVGGEAEQRVFDRARQLWAQAELARRQARVAEKSYNELGIGPDTASQGLALVLRSLAGYERAARSYEAAHALYEKVIGSYGVQGRATVQGYYQNRPM